MQNKNIKKKSFTLLAIESSCDETAASVLVDGKILSNIIASQEIHKKYGGVVPELASRQHQRDIVPVVDEALKVAQLSKIQLNAIAFTKGPGLLGSLLVGTCFAKAMAQSLNIPAVDVEHLQAHIHALFIGEQHPDFPFMCLTVSGGHTQIVLVKDYFDMLIVGKTLDDAAGEAYDKAAKLMGLPYPGGPLIDKYAQKNTKSLRFNFPEPNVPGFDYSFSGLKTSIMYFLREQLKSDSEFITKNINEISASIQHRIVSILLNKFFKAAKHYHIENLAIAGGVSANSLLRKEFLKSGDDNNWKCFIPDFSYCTDNAAMIAMSGYLKLKFLNNSLLNPITD